MIAHDSTGRHIHGVTKVSESKLKRESVNSADVAIRNCKQRVVLDPQAVYHIVDNQGFVIETVLNSEFWEAREMREWRRQPYIVVVAVLLFSSVLGYGAYLYGTLPAQLAILVPIISLLLLLVEAYYCYQTIFKKSNGYQLNYGDAVAIIPMIPFVVIILWLFT